MAQYPFQTKIWPILKEQHKSDGVWSGSIPDITIVFGIEDLWCILEMVVQDWETSAKKAQAEIDNWRNKWNQRRRSSVSLSKLIEMKPRYLQCLFSYITFFLMMQNGYSSMYSQMRELNRKPDFRIKPDKKPKAPDIAFKIKNVRDHSIAHWADFDQQEPPDFRQGLAFLPHFEGNQIRNMQFGGTYRIPEAGENDLPPIPELHAICTDYLREYDRVCRQYLDALKSKLPYTDEDGWLYTLHPGDPLFPTVEK